MIDLDPISLVDDTLDWVNEQRKTMGLAPLPELPKGVRNTACDCPVARALGGTRTASTTSYDTIVFGDDDEFHFSHPEYVGRFINAFDDGAFPHLIDPVPLKQEAF